MSDDAHVHEVVQQLQEAFGEVLRDCFSSLQPSLAHYASVRLCEALQAELRGMRVTVPAGRLDHEAITADWSAGLGIGEIMQRHGCSRASAYRYHPSRRSAA